MSEAKEKAKELINKFSNKLPFYSEKDNLNKSKQCALIAVEEILWEIIKYSDNSKEYVVENYQYWQEVKTEIEKL